MLNQNMETIENKKETSQKKLFRNNVSNSTDTNSAGNSSPQQENNIHKEEIKNIENLNKNDLENLVDSNEENQKQSLKMKE